jgi:pimeloyl-ACP methyl ester carboxylesterase
MTMTMTATRRFLWVLAALAFATSASAQSAAPPTREPATVVLVHGALIDGSSWRGVYDVLTKDGYQVRIVQTPLTGFDEDVAATQRVLDQVAGPVVLVGHSYGGSIITAAGGDPKVKALVYVAALQPDVGETSAEVAPPKPSAENDFRVTKDGFIFLAPSKFAADFGADLPKAQAAFMASSQMPIKGAAFTSKLSYAAWHDKPSYAVNCHGGPCA